MRTQPLAFALVLVFLVSGCGGNGDDEATSSSSSASSSKDGSGSGSASSSTKGATPGADATGKSSTGGAANGKAPSITTDDRGAPGAPDKKGRQSVVFTRLPGNDTGSCLKVKGQRDVRSGGFVAGPFDDAIASYGKVRPGFTRNQVRLYWVPMHTKPMSGVTVTATQGGKSVTKTQKSVADAEQWKFYDTILTLPSRGTWRFKATSGQDTGCFVATF